MQRKNILFLVLMSLLSTWNLLWGQATPALVMSPASQHADINAQFNITIAVQDIPGPPGQEMRGCGLIIAFDPALLQVVSLTDGTFLSSFGPVFTPKKTYNNTTGTIEYDSSILGNGPMAVGSGDLLIIRFRAIASGTVDLNFTQDKLRDRGNYDIIHIIEEGTVYSGTAHLYIDLPHTSVNAVGDLFTIHVNIENAFNVKGADVYLNFDPLRIEVVSTTLGDFFSSQGFTTFAMFNTQTAGLIKYNESITAPQGVGGQGAATLFNVVFRAKANGYGTLTFNTTETKLRNPENQPISYTYVNGSYDIGPIAVNLALFQADAEPLRVLVQWTVANEIGLAGYNLLRTDVSENCVKIVNEELILAQGAAQSMSYQLEDFPPHEGNYLYTLQEVSTDGGVTDLATVAVWYQPQDMTTVVSANNFTVLDNYPNPFNSNTVIRFSLRENGPTRLAVYDSLGKLVTVLTNEYRPCGLHEVLWNGRDADGTAVVSGVYYFKLTTREEVQIKAMCLLK